MSWSVFRALPVVVVIRLNECENFSPRVILPHKCWKDWNAKLPTIDQRQKVIEEINNEDRRSKRICTYLDRYQFVSGKLFQT